ncbi:hypothetical protein LEP1GSC016_4223 [Leptospira borgpetersenii serovar Hardjo-bovis str. Sponselee]|uniref:Uncharacterized protein n=1 Tax=Leptospira borgpetersenii serovar Hardjo-bovis str. Sponselee TaxID=1303729 RepID=M6BQD9_LEPBO|nr:hypothetical protein LBK6_12600 [Leptospira borgpetersenii serovar Hardjo]AWV70883.1 hypothetical protein B9T54_13465 [Leptospira borgpetersenii serovar Hardjo-bovis]EMJ80806.1 hypothetical protein LEP1GSC016_4223 [Leptospira borgpetersenii serovar Hardjo-bovis str. Sponselee]TQE54964.1 hypothetical protein FFZ95_02420 [Leptospira borgpetersenii]AMX62369.1 hypothetical protein LBK9_12510 [Leptospira borgpetersenii serovar Hardjo]
MLLNSDRKISSIPQKGRFETTTLSNSERYPTSFFQKKFETSCKKNPQFLQTYGKLFLLQNVSIKKPDESCINTVRENER